MKRLCAALLLSLATSVLLVPPPAQAAAASPDVSIPELSAHARVQPGRGKRGKSRGLRRGWTQGRHRGWFQGRRAYWYYRDPYDSRYVRRVYYVSGRPYFRWVWFY